MKKLLSDKSEQVKENSYEINLRILRDTNPAGGVLLEVCMAQITPSDDSYIFTSSPTEKFGAKNILIVQGPGATTFIRFDLSSLPSGLTSAGLAKATLKVYVSAVTDAGTFDVDRVTSSWTEKIITADTEPTLGAAIASAVAVPGLS